MVFFNIGGGAVICGGVVGKVEGCLLLRQQAIPDGAVTPKATLRVPPVCYLSGRSAPREEPIARGVLKNFEFQSKQQLPSGPGHSRESGNPEKSTGYWMPVFTGMTNPTRLRV